MTIALGENGKATLSLFLAQFEQSDETSLFKKQFRQICQTSHRYVDKICYFERISKYCLLRKQNLNIVKNQRTDSCVRLIARTIHSVRVPMRVRAIAHIKQRRLHNSNYSQRPFEMGERFL